jgi:16S rRNA C1402 N4-methylase RsmH
LKQGQEAPTKEELNKAVARVLQAIRIEVNAEFTSLDRLLAQLPSGYRLLLSTTT